MPKAVLPFILILLTLITACNTKAKKVDEKLVETANQIIVSVDERTEFFRTIFNLAVQDDLPDHLQPCRTDYWKEINTYFEPYKNHALIKYIYHHDNMGIDFPTIGLMYDDLENFTINPIYHKAFPMAGMTKKEMDAIGPLLQDFYVTSNFSNFFKDHATYYANAVKHVQEQIDKEQLFTTLTDFYQSNEQGLAFHIIVELTNNANNKAVSFYEQYNPKKRAVIVANLCEDAKEPTINNTLLRLDNNLRTRIYHEASHLFTDQLLDKHLGDLKQYASLCENCSAVELKDKIDHLIIIPIQELIAHRAFGKADGHNFFMNSCTDVRKAIYKILNSYQPEDDISFEEIYIKCINAIKQSAAK